jgi:hypothetical protein
MRAGCAVRPRGPCRPPRTASGDGAPAGLAHHLRSAPFLLIGVFVVIMMAITAALPAHMVSLLRENGLSEAVGGGHPGQHRHHPGAGAVAAVCL